MKKYLKIGLKIFILSNVLLLLSCNRAKIDKYEKESAIVEDTNKVKSIKIQTH
jgi:hypothetical protein